ncbi:sel1 repeat family protein [Vibrio sinensis]|uniref:Sel1 repeat family protein n=1 Tax=Vibrio sinensis TaxID=2302434 RepID=A0A3A6Q939_9VIBR|nr:sel1 repeat family protein [Vibrio sinensis]RJX66540.1 sel1 repeat family protein [Vibrio sinensis]
MTWSSYYRYILVAFAVSFSSLLYADQSIDGIMPEQAYQQGTLLYQQNKYTQARPLLKYATAQGYPAAALMYADTFYANLFIQTKEESEYIVKAAEMGSIIGMLRAGGSRAINEESRLWKAQSSRVINNLAEQGNAFAMELLYSSVKDRGEGYRWLKKAAEAGDPFSQCELARRYEMGNDWFLIPGKREKETERLFKAAADSGYWPAMRAYAFLLHDQGDINGYQAIIDELIEIGDAAVIRALGSYYRTNGQEELSAYYYKIYVDSMGHEGKETNYDTVKFFYDEVVKSLTPEQINQVDIKVKEYLKTHTVRYQKRIKDYEYTLDSFNLTSN